MGDEGIGSRECLAEKFGLKFTSPRFLLVDVLDEVEFAALIVVILKTRPEPYLCGFINPRPAPTLRRNQPIEDEAFSPAFVSGRIIHAGSAELVFCIRQRSLRKFFVVDVLDREMIPHSRRYGIGLGHWRFTRRGRDGSLLSRLDAQYARERRQREREN